MKKILIMILALASMLLADANVTEPVASTTDTVVEAVGVDKVVTPTTTTEVTDVNRCKCKTKSIGMQQNRCKCTSGGKCDGKGDCKCKGMKNSNYSKGNNANKSFKNAKKSQKTQFLINRGLTPLLRMTMMSAKDPLLGLDVEQFTQLSAIKADIMPRAQKIKTELKTLRHSVTMAVTSGTTVEAIKVDVERLGALKAEQTLLRIECMNRTKAVLTKDQLIYLLSKSTSKNKNCNSSKCRENRYNKNR